MTVPGTVYTEVMVRLTNAENRVRWLEQSIRRETAARLMPAFLSPMMKTWERITHCPTETQGEIERCAALSGVAADALLAWLEANPPKKGVDGYGG